MGGESDGGSDFQDFMNDCRVTDRDLPGRQMGPGEVYYFIRSQLAPVKERRCKI
jgi:hypothetical protein